MRWIYFIVALLLFIPAPLSQADLLAIDYDKLQHIAEIRGIRDDIILVANHAEYWSPEWKYDIPKEKIINTVKNCLQVLEKCLKKDPDNLELILLQGLMAHYAYNLNLNLKEYYEIAEKFFKIGQRQSPDDIRPTWFLGLFYCQASHIELGMQTLKSVQTKSDQKKIPAKFWEDYAYCASMANMPSNTLMAIDIFKQINGGHSRMTNFLHERISKLLLTPSIAKEYTTQEAWSKSGHETNGQIQYINRMFGYSLQCPQSLKVKFGNVNQGKTILSIDLPEKKGLSRTCTPSATIITATSGTSFSTKSFLEKILPQATEIHAIENKTSIKEAITMEGYAPKACESENGTRFLILSFSKPEPKYPGITFENPVKLPLEKNKTNYFRATAVYSRFKVPIHYIIILEAPASVYEEACRGFNALFTNFFVE